MAYLRQNQKGLCEAPAGPSREALCCAPPYDESARPTRCPGDSESMRCGSSNNVCRHTRSCGTLSAVSLKHASRSSLSTCLTFADVGPERMWGSRRNP
eukprot:18446-Pyramimonas_sp.AAC.1